MPPYLVLLLIFGFFPARLVMLPYWPDSNVAKLLTNLAVNKAICLLYCQLYFVIVFQLKLLLIL